MYGFISRTLVLCAASALLSSPALGALFDSGSGSKPPTESEKAEMEKKSQEAYDNKIAGYVNALKNAKSALVCSKDDGDADINKMLSDIYKQEIFNSVSVTSATVSNYTIRTCVLLSK